jgi:arginyl-tRNA synthetase
LLTCEKHYPDALITANALDLGDLVGFYRKAKQRFDEDEAFRKRRAKK